MLLAAPNKLRGRGIAGADFVVFGFGEYVFFAGELAGDLNFPERPRADDSLLFFPGDIAAGEIVP